MSAAVCAGSKRSFIDDIETTPPQPSKKFRCSSTSPPPPSSPLRLLAASFPSLDFQVLELALAECNNDLDSAMKNLHEHHSRYMEKRMGSVEGISTASTYRGSIAADGTAFLNSLPSDGVEWVELFVREMKNAANLDDAKARATRALNGLEKSISARADVEAAQTFHEENVMLKEQVEVLMRENTILKRGVAIQHERQKEYDDRNIELQMLKQVVVPQYQEQLRTLQVKNYTLSMHLRQMQQISSLTGPSNPDIF